MAIATTVTTASTAGANGPPVGGNTVPTAPPAVVVPDTGEMAKLDAARRDIALKERQHVMQVRKFSEEKKAHEASLQKVTQIEKLQAQAKLNPEAFLKSIYGDKWYDVVVESRINGVPPAQLLADEIAKVEEKFEKKFAERDEARTKADADSQKKAIGSARRQLNLEALDFLKAKTSDYPIFAGLGGEVQVAQLLAQRIEAEYNRTEKRDAATGELLQPGRVLSTKEAADALENELLGFAEKAATSEKYRAKLQEKLQPPKQVAKVAEKSPQRPESSQQRRTLSNEMTGSTPGRQPPASREERMQRAIAAYNAQKQKAAQP